MNDAAIERLAAEYIAADWTPDRYYRDMNLIAFATKLLEHGYAEGRKDEREACGAPEPEPAFPINGAAADHQFCGLHMRDYFAAAVSMVEVPFGALEALEGTFPAYADAKAKQDWYARAEATFRYHRADAMLKARQS